MEYFAHEQRGVVHYRMYEQWNVRANVCAKNV